MCWQRQARLDDPVWGERRQTPPPADLRVSDADRQVVIDDLQRHTADGRLTLDEFEERVDEVLRARTGAELRVVTRDLPSTAPPQRSAGLGIPLRPLLVVCAVALLLVTGAWWLLIPAFFLFGGCGHHAARAPMGRRHEHDDAVTYV